METNYQNQREEDEIIRTTRIGIIGGGQLGLMLGEAARAMGVAGVTVLDPTLGCPASRVAEQIVGGLKDAGSLRLLAERSDVLTYEIEHINTEALQALRTGEIDIQIYPAPDLLAIIQDKYRQKEFLARYNIPVAPFFAVDAFVDLERAIRMWGYPLVLKARRDAYDGRGNARINTAEDIEEALVKLGERELYVEQCVDLEKELGLMTARNARGESVSHPVVEMVHVRDICQTVIAPARIAEEQLSRAKKIARQAIDALSGVGIFGVELFLDKAGKIWLNEIAPRPHNLGHYTIEACETSQYVQHLRAVMNLHLTSTAMLYPVAVMENILLQYPQTDRRNEENLTPLPAFPDAGHSNRTIPNRSSDFVPGTRNGPIDLQGVPNYDHEHIFVHLYGKRATRIDRKMGHITVVGTDLDQVYQKAKEARAALSI